MPKSLPNGPLTLEAIVDAAVALVDERGYDALTMRELAARCEVGVMTLYGYVRTKEELLAAIADRLFTDLDLQPATGEVAWQEHVKTVFRAVRATFVAHPELAEVVAKLHTNAQGSYRGAEVVLGAMRQAGIGARDAVSGFVALTTFTTGFAVRQANAEERAGQSAQRMAAIGHLSAAEFPTVLELAGLMLVRESDEQFEDGLDFIVRGISARAAS